MIEQIAAAATEMYLAHAEPGIKRTYANRDWAGLERAMVGMEAGLRGALAAQ
jgi:hypothetical protein